MSQHPLVGAVEPVARASGGLVVAPEQMEPGDVPLVWDGEVVGGFRPGSLHGALERLLASVEHRLGTPLASMNREQKQLAVRMLDDAGAFALRHGVEDVADALGVSRFTVYNYLNARRAAADATGSPTTAASFTER